MNRKSREKYRSPTPPRRSRRSRGDRDDFATGLATHIVPKNTSTVDSQKKLSLTSQQVSVPSTSTADQSVGVESNKESPKNKSTIDSQKKLSLTSQQVSVPSTLTANQSVGVESNKKSPKNKSTIDSQKKLSLTSQQVSVPSTSTADQSVGVESNKKSPKNLITSNGTSVTDANKKTLTTYKHLMAESASNKQQLSLDSLQSNDSTTLKSTQSLIPSNPQPVAHSQSVDPKLSDRQQLSTNSQQSSGSLFVRTRKYSKNKNAIQISTNATHFTGPRRNNKKKFVKNNLYHRVKNLESMIKQNERTSPQVGSSGQRCVPNVTADATSSSTSVQSTDPKTNTITVMSETTPTSQFPPMITSMVPIMQPCTAQPIQPVIHSPMLSIMNPMANMASFIHPMSPASSMTPTINPIMAAVPSMMGPMGPIVQSGQPIRRFTQPSSYTPFFQDPYYHYFM